MGTLKTATGKTFECDYFLSFSPTREVNIRILNASFADLAETFSNPDETVVLSYENQQLEKHTHLKAIVDDGNALRVVLGKE